MCKKLFIDLYGESIIPLMVNSKELSEIEEISLQRTINRIFSEQYCNELVDDYNSRNKNDKAILIDDFNNINLNNQGISKLFSFLMQKFDTIIILQTITIVYNTLLIKTIFLNS